MARMIAMITRIASLNNATSICLSMKLVSQNWMPELLASRSWTVNLHTVIPPYALLSLTMVLLCFLNKHCKSGY
jgi:PhoPQ-activated pathogenicity-related protein